MAFALAWREFFDPKKTKPMPTPMSMSTATFSFVHAYMQQCIRCFMYISTKIHVLRTALVANASACVFRLRNARIARNASACDACVVCFVETGLHSFSVSLRRHVRQCAESADQTTDYKCCKQTNTISLI